MVVVNGILTSYYPQNGIVKIHKLEFKAVRGDLMRFSDIIKKQIKPTETEFNRPKANLSKISICKQNGHLITKANLFLKSKKADAFFRKHMISHASVLFSFRYYPSSILPKFSILSLNIHFNEVSAETAIKTHRSV